MLPVFLAILALQLPDPPGLVVRIGSPAFRSPPAHRLMATSPDGSRLYTADIPMNCLGGGLSVNRLAVLDAETGRVVASYPTPWWSRCNNYEFGEGELRLFVHERGNPMGFLRVVDLNTGRVVREGKPWRLPGDGTQLYEARLAHGGARPIFSDRKTTALLDPETGTPTPLDPPIIDEHPSAYLSADGQLLAAYMKDGSLRVYDARTGKLRRTIAVPGETCYVSQFLPGGQMTMWVGGRGQYSLDVLDADGKRVCRLFENQPTTLTAAFDSTGKTFLHQPLPPVAGGESPPLEIRDAVTNRVIGRLPRDLRLAQFDRTGKTVWAQGRALVPFDAATGEMKANAPYPPDAVAALAFRGDDQLVGLASELVLTWDAKTGRELARTPVPAGWGAKFNAAGDALTFSQGAKHFVWDARTGVVRPTAKGPPLTFQTHAFGPNDKVLAELAHRDARRDGDYKQEVVLSLFEMPARKRIVESRVDLDYAEMFGFSPDGRLFAVGDSQKVLLIDAATGRVRATVRPRGPGVGHPRHVCWSPGGRLLALTAPDGCVEVWDVAKVVGQ